MFTRRRKLPENGSNPEPPTGEPREFFERPSANFEVREGDRLTVSFNAAKLQIAPFSTVELDGGIYSRSLEPGDDPVEQWDLIYGYLKTRALNVAREKLATFADELAKAKLRATGNKA